MKEGPLTRPLVISAAMVTVHVVKVVTYKVCENILRHNLFLRIKICDKLNFGGEKTVINMVFLLKKYIHDKKKLVL